MFMKTLIVFLFVSGVFASLNNNERVTLPLERFMPSPQQLPLQGAGNGQQGSSGAAQTRHYRDYTPTAGEWFAQELFNPNTFQLTKKK